MTNYSFSDLIPAVVQNRVFFWKPKSLQHFRILPKACDLRVFFNKLLHLFRCQLLVLSIFQNSQDVQFGLFLFYCAYYRCVRNKSRLYADLGLRLRFTSESARTSASVLTLHTDLFLMTSIPSPCVNGLERRQHNTCI